MASFAQSDAVVLKTGNSTATEEYTRFTIQSTTAGSGTAGTANAFLSNAYLGIGAAPAVPVDIYGTNTAGLRIRGPVTASEIMDLYCGSSGELIASTVPGGDVQGYIDFRSENTDYGFVIRESDGTGTAVFLNMYVVDAAYDYANFTLSATNATPGFVISDTANDDFGFGTITPDGVQVNVLYAESTAKSVDNVRLGVDSATGRIMFEDDASGTRWQIDNTIGYFRLFVPGTSYFGLTTTGEGNPVVNFVPSADNTYDLGTTTQQWRIFYGDNLGVGTTTLTGRCNASDTGAKTATTYDGYFLNTSTNTTDDNVIKYGMYVTSTGSFAGSTGAATGNYGIYIAAPTGADENVGMHVEGGAYIQGGNGDADGDGDRDAADATRIRNWLAGSVVLSKGEYAAADLNGDRRVNDLDADLIDDIVGGTVTLANAQLGIGKHLNSYTLNVHYNDDYASPTGYVTVRTNNIGVTVSDDSGLGIQNDTAATVGTQQYSPILRWSGQGWKTNATAESQEVSFRSYVVSASGSSPTGYLTFAAAINGGAYSTIMTFHSGVKLAVNSTTANVNCDVNGDFAARAADLSLANGSNNNIAIGARSFIRVTGPTGAFTITGIASGFDGKRLVIYNTTTQNMTLTDLDAGSSSGNQIRLNGASAATTGEGICELVYDVTLTKWTLVTFTP